MFLDSGCQLFGMINVRAAKRLGLTVKLYYGKEGLVGWNEDFDPNAVKGRVSTRVTFPNGLSRWYRFWVTEESGGFDSILGIG